MQNKPDIFPFKWNYSDIPQLDQWRIKENYIARHLFELLTYWLQVSASTIFLIVLMFRGEY